MLTRISFQPDEMGHVRDFDAWLINENGLVEKTEPWNVPSFVGCRVDLSTLAKGRRLEYSHPRLGTGGIKYPVASIEEVQQ